MKPAELDFWARMKRCQERSDDRLKRFRIQRLANLTAVVGPDYGEADATTKAQPINMAYQLYTTLTPHVVARNPQADVSTYYGHYQVFAYQLEQAVTWLFDEIDLEQSLGMMFADGLAGWGVLKIGREAGLSQPFTRGRMQLRPFAKRVSLDNLVFDPDCGDIREAAFIGDVYEINKDYALDAFKESADRLNAEDRKRENEASGLTRKGSKDEQLYRKLRVIDLWLAPGNPIGGDKAMIITVPAGGEMFPLESKEYSADSPYEFLGLCDVPDNPLPLAPLTAMAALGEMINAAGRKQTRQMEREKTILAVERGAEKDGETVIKTADGQAAVVTNVDRMKEVTFSGPDPKAFTYTQWLIQMYNRQGGNQDILAGAATGANTATESALLGQNSDIKVMDLKRRLYKVVKRVVRRLGGMLLDDAGIDVTLGVGSPFLDPVRFTPEYRRQFGGDTGQYTFDIQPYSMEPDDPKKRIENIMLLVNQVIVPTLAAAQAGGKQLDAAKLVDIVGNELHIKELAELYHDAPVMPGMGTALDGASAPALPSPGGPRVTINPGSARGGKPMQMPQGAQRQPMMAGAGQ